MNNSPAGKSWSDMDLCILTRGIFEGYSLESIMQALGRSGQEVRAKIAELETARRRAERLLADGMRAAA